MMRYSICSFREIKFVRFSSHAHAFFFFDPIFLSSFGYTKIRDLSLHSRTKTKILSSNKKKQTKNEKKRKLCDALLSMRGRNNNTPSLLSNSFSFTRAYTKCVRSRNQADRKKKKKRFTHAHTKREKIL